MEGEIAVGTKVEVLPVLEENPGRGKGLQVLDFPVVTGIPDRAQLVP
jgi:hypothetical protein